MIAARLAILAALLYSALAGFRTMSDFDVWWQLASGRWMWINQAVLRQEVFSYTASGAPWTYPAGSGAIFYWIWKTGGANLLSLLAPLACLATALVLVSGGVARKNGVLRAWVLALAIPAIAWRTAVRADLFTTILTAVFLTILWEDHEREGEKTGRWLWTLPFFMALWVNLHPGFILGLAATIAFAARHPKRLAPMALATFAATFVNPYGWRIYRWVTALADLLPLPEKMHSFAGRADAYKAAFIGEFAPTPVSTAILHDAFFRVLDPDSSFWWLMGLAIVAAIAGLFRGRFWGVLMLAAAAVGAIACARFQGVFAISAVIVIPSLLADAKYGQEQTALGARFAAALLVVFVAYRFINLSSNRYYLTHGELASFGTGVSGWFPERAVRFIRDHRLPREVYNDYNLGGYLTWAASPEHPVYIDGRGDPYADDLFFRTLRMGAEGPEAQDWQEAIVHWKIRVLLVSVSRFGGFHGLPLKSFCDSPQFRLVYLDDTAAVFASPSAATEASVPALDCKTAALIPPSNDAPLWDRFQFYANAGKLYYALERDSEAEQAWQQARAIFDGESSLHLDIGQLRHVQGRMEDAEQEFRRAIDLRPTPTTYFALADLLAQQRRPFEAMEYFHQAALRDPRPHESWAAMARSALEAGRARDALEAANRALASNPYQGAAAQVGRGFVARTLALRGTALISLQQAPAAVDSLELAVRITSEPRLLAGLHLQLCEAYRAAGRLGDARRALEAAKKMGARGSAVERLDKELGSH